MLGVLIIAVIFTALAAGIAYAASKGGLSGFGKVMATETRGGKRVLNATLVVVYVTFAVIVPLIFIIGNHDRSNAQVNGVKLTASEQSGRELFAQHCATCHTLSADNAVGKTGPNLDILKPSRATVLHTIANGCLQNATSGSKQCLGYGVMPADVVEGQEAKDVASFVAAVAGHQ